MTSLNQPLAPKQDLCPNPFGNRSVASLSITLEDELTTLFIQDDIPSPQEHHSPQEPYRTKSGRTSKPPERLAFKALLEPYDYLEDDTFQDKHPLAFKAKSAQTLCTTTKP